ncbi:hypothetical protein [Brevibacillus nitrificans]|uniref:hypothetical protein n=1 Tax=Brevibacillus nitrificans TaxID=651560 RepID=UPI0028624550|nr:hypothetical protein [Brevibacillus nitrificans]MDR7319262.1 hypothetical protein [Brevibacillus nitrificans]
MFTVIKILVSAIIIWIITEVSRRFPAQGGVIAAMPIISILCIVWLYAKGEQTAGGWFVFFLLQDMFVKHLI